MLPVVDYGEIALVVAKIAAVGGAIEENGKFGFKVHLSGREEPVSVFFSTLKEAEEQRNELIAIIARYYYIMEFGPDFDVDDLEEMIDEDAEDGEGPGNEGDEDIGDRH